MACVVLTEPFMQAKTAFFMSGQRKDSSEKVNLQLIGRKKIMKGGAFGENNKGI